MKSAPVSGLVTCCYVLIGRGEPASFFVIVSQSPSAAVREEWI